jgi:hydrophobic/amphiphilic exporter-1 (mainly G- bacteria), HAE1 family
MFSRFFIDRPIFANVIAILTMILGIVAIYRLPVEQYPSITPPTIRVQANYPGANAQVVADTVAAPIEQQVNGVERMLYMSSSSSGDGSYSLTVTMEIGTDLDDAQVMIQNRLALAEPQLPEEVKRQGITVKKQSTNIILVIALTAIDNRYDALFLSNYASLRLRDELSRVPGVGEVTIFGVANYSMRVWLDSERMKYRRLTAPDVMRAIREQNLQVAPGQIGQPPSPDELAFQYTITATGRLQSVDEFEKIVIKRGDDGRVTYLGDVARIELGSQSYDQYTRSRGKPNANVGIYQLPGANAIEVAKRVREAMERIKTSFPDGMQHVVTLDTTKFIEASIQEVYVTLIEAGLLVLLVILLFLQDWRAVLIPATTVPVTIIGAFAAMALLGFSINILTLFGLVLAIGIVVDDAIVIVENATHHIEQGMSPRQATIQAMSEVLGPIVGITLVLLAVFVPSIFLTGITGQLYRQFALTIAATALISAINAVTLKPAQSALWLRPKSPRKSFWFGWFNTVYAWSEALYLKLLRWSLGHVGIMLVAFGLLVGGGAVWYRSLPTGFFPIEDQGYILVNVQLPDASSIQRNAGVMNRIDEILLRTPGIKAWTTLGGLSLLDFSSSSNAGTVFVTFDDWHERKTSGQTLDTILGSLRKEFAKIQEAVILAFPPPAIRGLGFRSGFQMQIEDRAGRGLSLLDQVTQEILLAGQSQSTLTALNSTFRPGVPQLFIDIDRRKVSSLNVALDSLFATLQATLGSTYVNDFNKFGRIYQVRVQADQPFRSAPSDIERLVVRSRDGKMVPVGAFAQVQRSFGPQVINRYNLFPSAVVSGEPAPGVSTGDALDLMEQVATNVLPDSMEFEWTGMAYQERKTGGEAVLVFSLAVILVYFVLAAQYESWALPFAVILVVPLGLLGAVGLTSLRGMDNNIYSQVGMVLIIALASKNAILIVEFATDLRRSGAGIREAAIEAARLRFRPILMTSLAFILGVLPLAFANGAGANGQRSLGTAVLGGMITATVLAVFFVPTFFVVIESITSHRLRGRRSPNEPLTNVPEQASPSITTTV